MKKPQNAGVKVFAVILFLLLMLAAAVMFFQAAEKHSIPELLCAVAVGALGAVVWIFLLYQAGRTPNRDGITLNWQDRIPLDLYLAIIIIPVSFTGYVISEVWDNYPYGAADLWTHIVGCLFGLLPLIGLALAFTLTLATRIKSGTVWSNTLLFRFFRYCRAVWRTNMKQLPMLWRSVVVFGLYILLSAIVIKISGSSLFLYFIWQLAVLALVTRFVSQWNQIRLGTAAIVNGDTDYHIDTARMLPELKEHAEQLNSMGLAINKAVEERFKSEHFKAELITNVSHDLKTPLTSIINYVDLLKKENIESEAVQGYLEVLDRKSQRLKKLTEDLVEASKASTGNLAVVKDRLDLVQLVTQATGEYEEKMKASSLSLRQTLPQEPVYVVADGRHLWRILDNLLGNCTKYALEGTRVYLEISVWQESVVLAVKNISREPLNMDPDALMERFVRGDESRTTEGSGLGLSIARSLTELQGGIFDLSIDGDLFKAIITLPLAESPSGTE
jgi:signal transduction histidine kinase